MSTDHPNENENEPKQELHLGVTRVSTGRSPMIHLAMLVGLLVLVIWAMVKARDPKSWEWMGFDDQDEQNEIEPEAGTVKVNQAVQRDNNSQANSATNGLLKKIRDQFSGHNHDVTGGSASVESKEDKLRYSFWSQIFERMTNRQRSLFQQIMLDSGQGVARQSDNNSQQDADEENPEQLLEYLDRQRLAFDATILRQTADMETTRAAENKLWSDLLLAMQNNWSQKIKPILQAYQSNESLTEDLAGARAEMLALWSRIAWDALEDYSVNGLSVDTSAWNLALHRLSEKSSIEFKPTLVTTIDLMAQPEIHRGKFVSIKGRLLRVELIKSENQYAESGYKRLWVKADGPSKTPYCVYTLNTPEGFPQVKQASQKFNDPISLDGIFFKVMVYTDADNNGASCPLVLANSFQWSKANDQNTSADVATSEGESGLGSINWLVVVGSITVVCACLWWFVIRMEASPKRVDSSGKLKRVNNTMDNLEKRDDILDVHQRLSQLEQQDNT